MKALIHAILLGLLLALDAGAVCSPPQWDATTGQSQLIQYVRYFSPTANVQTVYGVYLPAAYTLEPERRFPVLYWAHGGGGDVSTGNTFISMLHDAIGRGVVAPFIVVLLHGPQMFWTDSKPGGTPYNMPIESVIINDLIPLIDSTYRTIATRAGRGIEGFSMGGRGSARIGLKHHDKFSLVSILAGAFQGWSFFVLKDPSNADECVFGNDEAYFNTTSPQTHANESAPAIIAGPSYEYRIVVGDADTGNGLKDNRGESIAFSNLLTSLGIGNALTIVPVCRHSYVCLYSNGGDPMFTFFNPWASRL